MQEINFDSNSVTFEYEIQKLKEMGLDYNDVENAFFDHYYENEKRNRTPRKEVFEIWEKSSSLDDFVEQLLKSKYCSKQEMMKIYSKICNKTKFYSILEQMLEEKSDKKLVTQNGCNSVIIGNKSFKVTIECPYYEYEGLTKIYICKSKNELANSFYRGVITKNCFIEGQNLGIFNLGKKIGTIDDGSYYIFSYGNIVVITEFKYFN